MQIIIPMAGTGNRFIKAGYATPKPLIEVDGLPMIEHVVNLFPGESDFLFICNRAQLENPEMEKVLRRIAPECEIAGIEPHKRGPVHSVCEVIDKIRDGELIVNYCDFGTYWNYPDFLKHTRDRDADGAIPSYRGFHPHMLHPTNYAFILEDRQWMKKIQEKKPFTGDRMNEFASNGTYYFKKGEYVRRFFPRLMELDINVDGEYYVSMVYNLMVEAGLKISVCEVQHMLQWGSPGDMEEYRTWSHYFQAAVRPRRTAEIRGALLVPMAGKGARFEKAGYDLPKPLIPVAGKPMFAQAAGCAPRAARTVFACLREHIDRHGLFEAGQDFPGAEFAELKETTDGQATTARISLAGADPSEPVFVSACDNGMLWDPDKFLSLIGKDGAEAVIWTFRGNPCVLRDPRMYGWVKIDGTDRAAGVSVKKPVSIDPIRDHAIVGAFYFSSVKLFMKGYDLISSKNIRVNGELYIDSLAGALAEAGHDVRVFEVDHYVCWGTPDDLKTYEYWQSYFHKCVRHPYRLEKDPMVPAEAVRKLDTNYSKFSQKYI